ncbi:hypothetical protein SmJEL517_g06204 [Synchytrium microbalum]|uniref:Muskelin N-terminal domain-containing protein n=1 Tax=Synchytrium microbalum TaxID=1806994 RepID=A0A507BWL6_9FUNG|nr:uncharacterized protein SmJEL517_g06204 [Synchytrium microbalum]TPX30166.1 hypothetical protein SmJEL517_g06204 [Synchytrium microbalum]
MDTTNTTAPADAKSARIVHMAPSSSSMSLSSPANNTNNTRLVPHKIKYDIHSFSSHSASYHPKHIQTNKPNDQGSRWSSGSNNQSQFINIKLDKMSIVQTITFGKYHKVHVCNLKEFKVFGGLTPDNMIELLHSGLRNDTESETFSLKYKVNNVVFPCLYIKILPLLAWGANFNFSIWFVELRGLSQPEVVEKAYWDYVNYREHEVVRLCLKHFRQRNYLDTFSSLQQRSHIQLEDSLLSELHKSLVLNGDFGHAEELFAQAAERELFHEHISGCDYTPFWKKIASDEESPCMRGGHQMTIDVESGIIYLIGGWDGQRDLADFWAFDQNTRRWTCISADTTRNGGPGPRSCHKICWDPKTRSVYLLGRYVDPDNRPNVNLESDFWRYDVAAGKWIRISANTAADGGPELIYDHQMCVDPDPQVLYVFGGRAIGPDASQTIYSGLYAYYIAQDRWRVLRPEGAPADGSVQLRSRIGHSMLFNHQTRELYIFAGQRNKDYLADLYVYDIENDLVHEMSRDYSKNGGPDGGFTQRATIDVDLGEFYVFSGLMREKASGPQAESAKNSFWVYSLRKDKWTRVYSNDNVGTEYWARMADREPCPRFAHQLVYDNIRKSQFLFGGNPGEPGQPNLRLDDFWELTLVRPTTSDVLRRARFLIKRQQFRELCRSDNQLGALSFLQQELGAVVNHADEKESKEFRELTQWLFKWGTSPVWNNNSGNNVSSGVVKGAELSGIGGLVASPSRGSSCQGREDPYVARSTLYEQLLDFFPESMREPRGNLTELVSMA